MNKFIVIGYGHIGKRHASIIQKNENFELFGVVEPNLDLWELIDTKIGTKFFASFELLLDSIDSKTHTQNYFNDFVAVIATPNYLHCKQALECLELGMHVLIEKPMGLSKKECLSIVDKAKYLNRKVFCVMQNRYSPPAIWLKGILETHSITNKILGHIYSVQINCIWNRSEGYYEGSSWKGKLDLDGGTLFTQFSHFIDTLLWLFGDVEVVHSHFYNFNHPYIEFEDSGKIDFEIKSGGVGSIFYSTSATLTNLESSITILAEKGTIKVGGQYMDQILACNVKNYDMPLLEPTKAPNDYGNYKGSASNHEFVYENLANVLAGKEVIHTTAEEGLMVVALIEEIYKTRTNIFKA